MLSRTEVIIVQKAPLNTVKSVHYYVNIEDIIIWICTVIWKLEKSRNVSDRFIRKLFSDYYTNYISVCSITQYSAPSLRRDGWHRPATTVHTQIAWLGIPNQPPSTSSRGLASTCRSRHRRESTDHLVCRAAARDGDCRCKVDCDLSAISDTPHGSCAWPLPPALAEWAQWKSIWHLRLRDLFWGEAPRPLRYGDISYIEYGE